jgi:hypothetical protein
MLTTRFYISNLRQEPSVLYYVREQICAVFRVFGIKIKHDETAVRLDPPTNALREVGWAAATSLEQRCGGLGAAVHQ